MSRLLSTLGSVLLLLLWAVPLSPVVARAEATDPPPFGVVLAKDVMVPMRDGIKLATDIYFPARDGQMLPGPWPVILERTPYDKTIANANAPDGNAYARRGYVMVRQDARGRYASEGVFDSYSQEGDDGIDAFNWIARQPWCNKKIAVTGSSYFASTAQAIMVQNPPELAAAVIRVGPGNYHEDGAWRGGAFLSLHNIAYGLLLASSGREALQNPAIQSALAVSSKVDNAYSLMVRSPLPAGRSPFALTPSYDKWYQEWQNHELYDAYWKKNANGFAEHYGRAADVPILLIGEWYDSFLGGMLDGFSAYGQKKSPVHLIMGGGEHYNVYSMQTFAGDLDLGASSAIDVQGEMFKWFDQYVKGVDRSIPRHNLLRAFRIEGGDGTKTTAGRLKGGGRWQEFPTWPPRDSRPTSYYLGANRSLTTTPAAESSLTYVYDPTRPVPTIGGAISSGAGVALPGPYDQRCAKQFPQCPDTLPLSARKDVLAFTTLPVAADVEVTGPVSVRLWVSSSAVDTDFTAKLIDQYPPTAENPDGYAMNIQDSIVRARLRSFTQPGPGFRRVYGLRDEPLTPGQVYEVTLDLSGVSYLFRAGHRIRLDVSSSNFPLYDANPNTGEAFAKRNLPPVVARNTIYMGAARPSQLVLPMR